MKSVVIMGNPIDGLTFVGPFKDGPTAVEWCDKQALDPEWWVAQVQSPRLWEIENSGENA